MFLKSITLLAIFVSLFFNLSAQEGTTECLSAPSVTFGTFETDNSLGDQWYKYTAASNLRLTISSQSNAQEVNTNLQIYDHCLGNVVAENDNAHGGTALSNLVYPVAAGEIYYILWVGSSTDATFDWFISEGSTVSGDLCQIPITASLGSNSVTNLAGMEETSQWFKYTAASDGIFSASNCSGVTLDTQVSIYAECSGDLLAFNDDDCDTKSTASCPVVTGEDYFILWEYPNNANANFNWNTSIRSIEEAEDCSMPASAVEGTNNADHSNGLSQWYTFTPVADKKMTISSCGTTENTLLNLYESCSESIIYSSDNDCANQSTIQVVTSGDEYLIEWSNMNTSSSYDWIITLADLVPGEACNNTLTATVGTNAADHSSGLSQWYSYTPTESWFLSLTTCGLTSENTIVKLYDACDGSLLESDDDFCETQSDLIYEVAAGETYLIEWGADYTTDSYSWDLGLLDLSGGDSCEEAVSMSLGNSNYAVNTTGSEWYGFITEEAYRVDISYCTSEDPANEDTQVNIYYECNTEPIFTADDECNATGTVLKFINSADVVYLVEWSDIKTSASYNWDFSLGELEEGDVCDLPIEASLGTNTATYEYSNEQWFSYTPMHSGSLTLTSCALTDEDTQVTLFASCEESSLITNDDFCSAQSSLTYLVEAQTTYLIKWNNHTSENSTNWQMTIDPIGESCDEPIEAQEGTNYAINSLGAQWFEYTPETDGQLKISTCNLTSEDTYFAVFDKCDGSSLFSSDNGCNAQSSQAGFVKAGVTYFIVWYDHQNDTHFNWELEFGNTIPGEVCKDPLEVSIGINESNHTNGTSQWFSFSPAKNGQMVLSHENNTEEDTKVILYDACGGTQLAYSNMECNDNSKVCSEEHDLSLTYPVSQGQTYLIEWSNQFSNMTYDWTLTLNDPYPGETCESPVSALEGGNQVAVDGKSSLAHWYGYLAVESGLLTISGCEEASFQTNIALYNGCENLLSEVSGINPELNYYIEIDPLVGFIEYQIEWLGQPASSEFVESCDWNLSLSDPGEGDICNSPINAKSGVQTAEFSNLKSPTRWYSYTASNDGTLKVSSCELTGDDTKVSVYEVCSGTSIVDSDNECDKQSVLETTVTSGNTYLIAWSSNSKASNFDWELSFIEEKRGEVLHVSDQSKLTYSIYPNPSLGSINISALDGYIIKRISIRSLTGREVFSQLNPPITNLKPNIGNGIYLLVLEGLAGEVVYSGKVVIRSK